MRYKVRKKLFSRWYTSAPEVTEAKVVRCLCGIYRASLYLVQCKCTKEVKR